jgi:predicted RND superfamily exporter protein
MKIESKQSYAIVSTTIRDINNREMRQMYELKNRINDVLASHKPDSKEKKYISDDDLKLTHAILSVFTKEYESTQTSAFDDFLKEQDKPVEQPQQQETKQSLSDPYHEDQTFG